MRCRKTACNAANGLKIRNPIREWAAKIKEPANSAHASWPQQEIKKKPAKSLPVAQSVSPKFERRAIKCRLNIRQRKINANKGHSFTPTFPRATSFRKNICVLQLNHRLFLGDSPSPLALASTSLGSFDFKCSH